MLTRPPDLSDAHVAQVVAAAWEIDVATIAHAPVGFGSHHWIVDASTGGSGPSSCWFVTVDDVGPAGRVDRAGLEAALGTARLLGDHGLDFVVAPRPRPDGGVVATVDDHRVAAVHPYVDGTSRGWGPYGDPSGRVAVLDRLVAVHDVPAGTVPAVTENFALQDGDHLERALTDLGAATGPVPRRPASRTHTGQRPREDQAGRHDPAVSQGSWSTGPFGPRARNLLRRHRDRVLRRLADHDRRAAQATADRARFVVTHGEPHRGNTIETPGDGLLLVDWGTTLLAPPERDLWWLTREDPDLAAAYHDRTGVVLDPSLLALYEERWALADLATAVADFRRPHVDNEDTRTSWSALRGVLAAMPPDTTGRADGPQASV